MAEIGRPTEYKEEYIALVDEYLNNCKDDGKTVKLPSKEGFIIWLKREKNIKICRATLYNWAEEHKDFLDTLEDIDIEQKEKLQGKGLSGEYNSTIAKLMLSANHGMREKSDVTTDDEPVGFIMYPQKNGKENILETKPEAGSSTGQA